MVIIYFAGWLSFYVGVIVSLTIGLAISEAIGLTIGKGVLMGTNVIIEFFVLSV